jgi:hypothetical protein
MWRGGEPSTSEISAIRQPSCEQAVSLSAVGARQRADLAELAEWVEGLRAAAAKARQEGKIALAEALDVTRFEVYDSYLDQELHQQSQAADDHAS